MAYKNLMIKKNMGRYSPGMVVSIRIGDDGRPVEQFWRDRLSDAKIDNCVEWKTTAESEAVETSNSNTQEDVENDK
jgi:hypothetical protein